MASQPSNYLTVFAGGGETTPTTDNSPLSAITADLGTVTAVAYDSKTGDVYVAGCPGPAGQCVPAVYQVSAGQISLFAGGRDASEDPPTDGGTETATDVTLGEPTGLAVDPSTGAVYIADNTNSQVYEVLDGNLSVVAGIYQTYEPPTSGSTAADSPLDNPQGVAFDPTTDSLYIADSNSNEVEEVDSTGKLTVFAGGGNDNPPTTAAQDATSVTLAHPTGVAVDSNGNVYIVDVYHGAIDEVTDGENGEQLSVIAGGGNSSATTAAQTATSVNIAPSGVAVDSSGNVYVADGSHNEIDEIDSLGSLRVIAGNGNADAPTVETATDSALNNPVSVAPDSKDGGIYIADNQNQLVEYVTATVAPSSTDAPTISGRAQEYSTLTASNGTWGNTPTDFTYQWQRCTSKNGCATISGATDSTYTLTSADLSDTIQAIVTAGNAGGYTAATSAKTSTITIPPPALTVAAGELSVLTDTTGAALTVTNPYEVAFDPSNGDVYIADSGENEIKQVTPTGQVSVIAGDSSITTPSPSTQAQPATDVALNDPTGVAVDSSGNIYIVDSGDNEIDEVSGGELSVIAGSPSSDSYPSPSTTSTSATEIALNSPTGVAVDSSGNVYITDSGDNEVDEIDSSGNLSVIAGGGENDPSDSAQPATDVALRNPSGVAVDSSGNVYIADTYNDEIEEVNSVTGDLSVIAGSPASDSNPSPSTTPTTATAVTLNSPSGVAVDSSGNVYIADTQNSEIEEVSSVTGDLSVVAGSPNGSSAPSTTPTEATDVTLNGPSGVAVDSTGNVYVADTNNSYVEQITSASSPTISDNTSSNWAQGDSLLAGHGNWDYNPTSYTYKWQRCNSAGYSCATISSANNSTYSLTSADVNHTIRAVVTATNTTGSTTATSAASQVIVPPAPTMTTAPSISDNTSSNWLAGDTLKASAGTWTNTPTSYAYQWYRCDATGATNCNQIDNANVGTYALTSADIDHTLVVDVTATNAGGSDDEVSSATTEIQAPPVPTNSGSTDDLPSITDSTSSNWVPGDSLIAAHGDWTNSPSSYTYQWSECDAKGDNCATIDNATTDTYTLASSDVGNTLEVTVNASNDGGSGTAVTSSLTQTINPPAPTNSVLPSISGTAQKGVTLTADPGTWENSPTSYSYQWQRCAGGTCWNIGSATSNDTYTLTRYDVGYTIQVEVTATNSGGSYTVISTSSATVTVPAAPTNSGLTADLPSISDNTSSSYVQGDVLQVTSGSWTNTPTSYTYQWQRCASGTCTNIGTADSTSDTTDTYTLTNTDVGDTIDVEVTATNAGGTSTTATSAETQAISSPTVSTPPTNSVLPSITGTFQQGQTLTAANGTWDDNSNNYTYTYQWQRCDSDDIVGITCTDITTSGTANTYVLTSDDVAHTIRLQVTATNTSQQATMKSSAISTVVLPPAPTNSGSTADLPTITDSTSSNWVSGDSLSVTSGNWTNTPTTYEYQWQRCSSTCTNINTPTSTSNTTDTYTLTNDDVGYTIQVLVTATNAGGTSTTATSAETQAITSPVVSSTAPVNSVLPSITGTFQQGQTLTAVNGTWDDSTSNKYTYTYQWQRCDKNGDNCADITTNGTAATGSTYVLSSDDVASTIRLQVTATNTSSQATTESSAISTTVLPLPPALSGSSQPSISGGTVQGDTLTADPGTWNNSPTYTYQWSECDGDGSNCTTITGVTTSTYVLASGDVGDTLKVTVTATNAGGYATADSLVVGPITAPLPPAPTNTAVPSITDNTSSNYVQGDTLKVTSGNWTNTPTTYEYQWQRCSSTCSNIGTADSTSNTTDTYTLTSDDVGDTIQVLVTATNAGGTSTTATSAATQPVTAPAVTAPVNGASPSISDSTTPNNWMQGDTLTADPGTWSNNPTGYSYQWQRCDGDGGSCSPITTNGTGTTYVLTSGDVNHTIKVTVKATNGGGSSSADSLVVGPVKAAPVTKPVSTGTPTTTGTAQQGQTLTASQGTWSNTPSSYSYQWLRCDASGNSCTSITGATSQSYTPTSDDVSHTIRVQVTATNSSGSTTITSDPSSVITAQTTNPVPNPSKCMTPTGSITGQGIGKLKLRMTQANAQRLGSFTRARFNFETFCVTKGASARVAFPTAALLKHMNAKLRRQLKGRVIIALTANTHYQIHGVRAGMKLATAKRHLHLNHGFKIGASTWYVVTTKQGTWLIRVQHGKVCEVGVTLRSLTQTRAQQQFLLTHS